ncbi:hypothetical protein Clacol_006094 [Clathrus columnatus]|uniref:Uncharacterized protein n=1 Tax=Clathrus columnatus TaxID=1419009 RepID=A0AAV5AH92_9AGAM|nr:hypothetical protein Clacol_006094 [Clathrus columnatus]
MMMMSSDTSALDNSPRVSIENCPSQSISVVHDPMKPLSSAQERRLTAYIDEQLSSLRTVDNYIEAVRPLLTLVLLIPPVGISTSLRSALFLRLTDEILDSITGYVPVTFDQVLDLLGELDRGWVAVLRSQGWNSVDKIGEPIPMSLSLSSNASISQTDRTRLRSLLSSGTDKIEEWLETVLPSDAEALEPAAALEGMKLRERFNDLFFQTLTDLGELHGDIRLDETDSEDEEYEESLIS